MKKWLKSLVRSKVFGVLLIAGLGAYLIHEYNHRPTVRIKAHLKLGYPESGGLRRAFVQKLANELTNAGATVEVIPMEGTEDVQSALMANKIDLDLVMGGFYEKEATENLRELMPLNIEPLHLLVKNEIYKSVSEDFGSLRGKSINMEDRHTGTHALAWEILNFANLISIDDDGNAKPSFESTFFDRHQVFKMKYAEMPDALFTSSAIPSNTVQKLVSEYKYRLIELPFGHGLALDRFHQKPPGKHIDGSDLSVDKSHVYETTIPAYVYGVTPAMPARPLPTMGTRLLLLGSKNLDPAIAGDVIATVLSPPVANFIRPALGPELLTLPSEFEEHPGREKYASTQRHITADDIFSFYREVLQKWGVVATVFLFLQAKLTALFVRRERKASVGDFLKEVIAIETKYSEHLVKHGTKPTDWHELDAAIGAIKHEVMHLYLEDKLGDLESLPHFLSVVAAAHHRISGERGTGSVTRAQSAP